MFRKRRELRLEQLAYNEKHMIYEYRGKPKKFVPKIFAKKRIIPRDIPHVTMHPSVRTVPENAFRDHEFLLSVVIPSTIKRIGAHAFLQCQSLAEVDFYPGKLKKIGPGAFLNTMLVMVHLPHGLAELGEFCFSGCTSLRMVSMPTSLKIIGKGAFLGCKELEEADFQEGLKLIGSFAYSDCKSLSIISFPESLKVIESRAFLYCSSLMGVEFLPSTKVKLGFECFNGCRALINVHIPDSIDSVGRKAFDECDCLGPGDNTHTISRLRHRFESLPAHKTCYYSKGSTVDDLKRSLGSSALFEDVFGMTPFHILATSTNPRSDFLACLLDKCPLQTLSRKDLCGKSMMDYLWMLTSRKAVPLIKMVLHRAVIDRISTWDQGLTWKPDLTPLLKAISAEEDVNDRRHQVGVFYDMAGYCTLVETMTILELATWKMRLNTTVEQDCESRENYRAACQYQCGAGEVIENVSGYLWDAHQAKSEAAKTTFRLFHAVDPGSGSKTR